MAGTAGPSSAATRAAWTEAVQEKGNLPFTGASRQRRVHRYCVTQVLLLCKYKWSVPVCDPRSLCRCSSAAGRPAPNANPFGSGMDGPPQIQPASQLLLQWPSRARTTCYSPERRALYKKEPKTQKLGTQNALHAAAGASARCRPPRPRAGFGHKHNGSIVATWNPMLDGPGHQGRGACSSRGRIFFFFVNSWSDREKFSEKWKLSRVGGLLSRKDSKGRHFVIYLSE